MAPHNLKVFRGPHLLWPLLFLLATDICMIGNLSARPAHLTTAATTAGAGASPAPHPGAAAAGALQPPSSSQPLPQPPEARSGPESGAAVQAGCAVELIVIGDSLSDTGNVYNLTGGGIPAATAYWHGRFADGPMWPDFLAQRLSHDCGPVGYVGNDGDEGNSTARAGCRVAVRDYAYGGATACKGGTTLLSSVPDLMAQGLLPQACTSASASAASSSHAGPGPAHVRLINLWIGHNDFTSPPHDWNAPGTAAGVAANVSACIEAALSRLMAALAVPSGGDGGDGGGNRGRSRDVIIVWTLAPIEASNELPPGSRAAAQIAGQAINSGLAALLARLQQRYPTSPALYLYDAYGAITCAINNSTCMGPLDLRPCLEDPSEAVSHNPAGEAKASGGAIRYALAPSGVACSDPAGHLWYDGVHLSSKAHELLLAGTLGASVEPSSLLRDGGGRGGDWAPC
ncbi:hypothetical protein VOLCADRAFT_90527 [Volvox carteri f. nagariensis]|uniref:SGNH hydrolase-type esterase domain-containing protein n=1 Tax=Volvox carteri f. nagariensis TaxID=3068 RepID=D8TUM4_VOLCA|nr:uncharacterized protein VOLCADRAFT_90527 [Volvox carteri f. nagariensis]EFJ48732.1 hypothetical protein VOLCADRAFT_90527 [Volvox carteri f. nagariensis]|eukprot:XP_002950064.1 hypothetical protein VOLCADRAFT_90527 [Volvox carteri f. nagariensis]